MRGMELLFNFLSYEESVSALKKDVMRNDAVGIRQTKPSGEPAKLTEERHRFSVINSIEHRWYFTILLMVGSGIG